MVTSIAAGQNTTFFLARPNDKFSDLPRHPVDLDTPQECIVCSQENGEDDSPLECDKVPCCFSSLLAVGASCSSPPQSVRLSISSRMFDPTVGRRSGRRMVLPPLSDRSRCPHRPRRHSSSTPAQRTEAEEAVPSVQRRRRRGRLYGQGGRFGRRTELPRPKEEGHRWNERRC